MGSFHRAIATTTAFTFIVVNVATLNYLI